MTEIFSKQYFAKNREKIRQKIDQSIPIVLSAHTLMQYSADTSFPFRQDACFWYLTGIDEPDFIYVHDGVHESIIMPKTNFVRDVFDGEHSEDSIRRATGIERILTHKQGMQTLKHLVKKHDKIATLLPATILQERYGIAPNPSRRRLINKLRRLRAGLQFQHMGNAFATSRMYKSDEEIFAIQSSIDITVDAFKKVKESLSAGMFEYQIESIMTGHFRSNNAVHAYSPIVAAGKNACTLHYDKNNSKIYNKSGLLIDVGAESYRGAADITRTYSVGVPSKRLKNIHAGVQHMHKYALTLLKIGTDMQAYEKSIENEMGVILKDLGLIKKASRKQIRKFYPHATSHFLGIDVHDIGDYSLPLKEGVVLTVEPGIYVPDESIGVRIEDNILITNNGPKVLSASLPTDL